MKKTNYEKQVDAIIKDASKNRGFIAELTRQFSKLSGEQTSRQQIDAWLRPDVIKRVVPNANTAELLLEAAAKTRKEFEK